MIAIYARQSIDKKDSISIESQIDFCKREVISEEEVKVYKDKGFSGKNIERPEFKKLIKDIKKGVISKVIAYKLDRVSRSILDFNNLMETFRRHNVEFISVTEKFDTSTAMGRAMLNIVITFAQLEREQIAQRVKDNYYERGKQGRFLGGRVPFGYNNKKIELAGKKVPILEINEAETLLIKKMFNMYSKTEMSLGNISDELNKEGYLSANNKAWDSNKISRILKNAIYVEADINIYNYYKSKGVKINNDPSEFENNENGCFVYGKRTANERRYTNLKDHVLSLGLHKGIIDSDTFLKCQYKLDANKQITRSGSGKHTWLTGLTKCGYCGYSMSAVVNTSGKYFNCRGKSNLKVCNGHSKTIFVKDIEDLVQQEIIERLEELSNINLNLENRNSNKIKEVKNEIKVIEEEIENLLEKISEANSITMKYINNKIELLDKEKVNKENKINKLVLEGTNNLSLKEIIKQKDIFNELKFEDKKHIASMLIEKIFIKDDEIEVIWKKFSK